MMPGVFYPDDGKWIKEQLAMLAPSLRNKVILRYGEVYAEVHTNTRGEHEKDGEARREANTRLREFVEKFGTLDIIKKPPLSGKRY